MTRGGLRICAINSGASGIINRKNGGAGQAVRWRGGGGRTLFYLGWSVGACPPHCPTATTSTLDHYRWGGGGF